MSRAPAPSLLLAASLFALPGAAWSAPPTEDASPAEIPAAGAGADEAQAPEPPTAGARADEAQAPETPAPPPAPLEGSPSEIAEPPTPTGDDTPSEAPAAPPPPVSPAPAAPELMAPDAPPPTEAPPGGGTSAEEPQGGAAAPGADTPSAPPPSVLPPGRSRPAGAPPPGAPPPGAPPPANRPGGPPEVAPRKPTQSGLDAYTPPGPASYTALRVGHRPALTLNPGEAGLLDHEQLSRYMLELGTGQPGADPGARARDPEPARLMMVGLTLSRTVVVDYPILPIPEEADSIYPGQGYRPRRYASLGLGAINAVQASFTLNPRRHLGAWAPVVAVDALVPTESAQGAAQVLIRLGGARTIPAGASALRLGIWGDFESRVVGLQEPVPGGGGGAFLMAPQGGRAVARLGLEYHRRGAGDFFNDVVTLRAEEALGLAFAPAADGFALFSAGLRFDGSTVDSDHYVLWTGAETPPFQLGADLDAYGRATLSFLHHLRLTGSYSRLVLSRDDPFIDGFYRPTGHRVDVGLSATFLKVLEASASFSAQQWDGATVRQSGSIDEDPPEAVWWGSMLTVGLGGAF